MVSDNVCDSRAIPFEAFSIGLIQSFPFVFTVDAQFPSQQAIQHRMEFFLANKATAAAVPKPGQMCVDVDQGQGLLCG